MGRPERGVLRPLALLLLLLRLQHLAAAADSLLGGQGACSWSPARICAVGAANKARPGGQGAGCARAPSPGLAEALVGNRLLQTELSLNLSLAPRGSLCFGLCSWGMGAVDAPRTGTLQGGLVIDGFGWADSSGWGSFDTRAPRRR